VQQILDHINNLGFQINWAKSILQPTNSLIYLGLHISTSSMQITPTSQCLRHLLDLVSILPQASRQDLQRIAGYVSWITYAMGWPGFLATLVFQRSGYWIRRFQQHGFLQRPRRLLAPLLSRQLYTDATPASSAAVFLGPPRREIWQQYTDHRPIAYAEMAAALKGLIWCIRHCLHQPTAITLHTDSTIVYHTIVKGGGWTLRSSALVQRLYVQMYIEMNKAGHSLVCRWVPSEENLADPLTRGVHPR
jgi:ribonuclease HI